MAVHLPLSIEAQIEAHDADAVDEQHLRRRPTASRSSRRRRTSCWAATDRASAGQASSARARRSPVDDRGVDGATRSGKIHIHARIKVQLPAGVDGLDNQGNMHSEPDGNERMIENDRWAAIILQR
jgi:hypothetical protein